MHMAAEEGEVDHVEGSGALNFLAIDDLKIAHEGEQIDPDSIIALPMSESGMPAFPDYERSAPTLFYSRLNVRKRSG